MTTRHWRQLETTDAVLSRVLLMKSSTLAADMLSSNFILDLVIFISRGGRLMLFFLQKIKNPNYLTRFIVALNFSCRKMSFCHYFCYYIP